MGQYLYKIKHKPTGLYISSSDGTLLLGGGWGGLHPAWKKGLTHKGKIWKLFYNANNAYNKIQSDLRHEFEVVQFYITEE